MIVPDANLLIYAYDRSSTHHKRARIWWENAMSGNEPVGIPCIVVLAFVRLMTHPTLSENPLSVDKARALVEEWLDQPHCRLLPTNVSTLNVFFDILCESGNGGNLCTDALIASIAQEFGGKVYSNDRDFERFKSIMWINPLD